MDVRAKQRISYHAALFPLACVYSVSPHVISAVRLLRVKLHLENFMKKTFSILCLVFALTFTANFINAQCDCGGYPYEEGNSRNSRYKTAYEELQNSAAVFVGKVIEVKKVKITPAYRGDFDYNYEIKFEVETSWKKDTPKEIIVTDGGGCILGFKKDEKYLVYASPYKKVLWASYCSRTRKFTDADEDLKEFEEKGEKPQDIVEKTKSE